MACSPTWGAAAVVAKARAQVVLGVTARAAVHQAAAGHRHEAAFAPLDDLQIANDKAAVECDRAEAHQAIIGVTHQLHANFGDFHGSTPSLNEDQTSVGQASQPDTAVTQGTSIDWEPEVRLESLTYG